MSARHHRPSSPRFARLVGLVAIFAAGCSQKTDAPRAPVQDYGNGIVSMEIVQRDMAARRARAAETSEPAESAPVRPQRREPLFEPPSRTGLVPVSTRGVIRSSLTAPALHAARLVPSASPATPATPAQATPLPVSVASYAALAVPMATTQDPIVAPTPPPAAAGTVADSAAPIFPSATDAARRLAPTAPVSGLAAAPAPAAVAPAASPVMAVVPSAELARIFSKDDSGVTPARLLSTTGAAGLNMDATDVNTMELVINKLGRVEQVKLVAPAKRMTDMLLLSGAKLWKFEPATKDGQPVRYRTQVSWQTTR